MVLDRPVTGHLLSSLIILSNHILYFCFAAKDDESFAGGIHRSVSPWPTLRQSRNATLNELSAYLCETK
jgi:hypothetical protein